MLLHKKVFFPVFFFFLIFLTSCFSGQSGKQRSTGKTNMMLVVTNNKDQWNGDMGQVIRDYFGQELPGLPQPESAFGFLNIAEKDLNDIYKKFHNIFIVNIDPALKETSVKTKKDLWSRPQRVIKINAPSIAEFYAKFSEQQEGYFRLYEQLSRERILNNFSMARDVSISNKLQNKFNIYLEIPGGFSIATDDKDFLWLRHTVNKVKQDVELGIMIYTSDYMDTSMFNTDFILNRRDIITKKYISGPRQDSYMKVADKFVKPVTTFARDFPLDYAIEIRGLWDLENDFMGGPFISYTFVDEKRGRIFTLDGYIYYPNEKKALHMRELESIFHSLKILEKEES